LFVVPRHLGFARNSYKGVGIFQPQLITRAMLDELQGRTARTRI